MNVIRKNANQKETHPRELRFVLLKSALPVSFTLAISYFIVAIIQHHDQKQLEQEHILAYFSRGRVHSIAAEAERMQSTSGQDCELSNPAPSNTFCPARTHHLPKRCHHLGTSVQTPEPIEGI